MRAKKALILISVVSFILLITGLTFAQEKTQGSVPALAEEQTLPPAEVQVPAPPAEEAKIEPEIQWVWGEVVSTNPINNELLVRYVDYDTDSEKEITVGTEDKTSYENAKSLAEIRVGDSVSIDYIISADGKNLARNISLEKPEITEETPALETAPAEVPSGENTEAAPEIIE